MSRDRGLPTRPAVLAARAVLNALQKRQPRDESGVAQQIDLQTEIPKTARVMIEAYCDELGVDRWKNESLLERLYVTLVRLTGSLKWYDRREPLPSPSGAARRAAAAILSQAGEVANTSDVPTVARTIESEIDFRNLAGIIEEVREELRSYRVLRSHVVEALGERLEFLGEEACQHREDRVGFPPP